MEFIKILFNIAFTVLITSCEAESGPETVVETTTQTPYKNNTALRKQEQIIDNSIDFQADPCEDFYQYACGKWQQQLHDEAKPKDDANAANDGDDDDDDKYNYDRTLGMIDYLADKEVQMYFNTRNTTTMKIKTNSATTTTTSTTTTAATTTNLTTTRATTIKEPDFVVKSYKYYKSCIAIEQYEPIKYLEWLEVNEHLKWPSLINTTKEVEVEEDQQQQQKVKKENEEMVEDEDYKLEDDWEEVIHDMKSDQQVNNFNWIQTLAVLRKYGLNGIFIEEIIFSTKTHPSKLIIGLDKPISDGGFKSLKSDHLKTILQSLNINTTEESFKMLWLDITKFEWKLIKLNDIADEVGPQLIKVEQFPVSWLKTYLSVALNLTDLQDNMKFVVTNAEYMIALDELLNEYDEYFLNKYLKIRFLWHLYKQAPYKFTSMHCISHIKHFMPLAFEWMFEQQHAELKEEIPKIQDIYTNIRNQFNVTLYRNRNNFETSILEYFVTKLGNIQLQVGSFPQTQEKLFFYNNRKFYSKLKLNSHDYYANHLKLLYFNFDTLHSLSSESIYFDMKEYDVGLNSAPYFNSRLNTIVIPLSLLQQPIYQPEFSDIYKYSTLGFLLAQTLMYGFNLKGLAVDEQGSVRQNYKCLGSIDSGEVDDKIATVSGFRLTYQTFFHSNVNNLNSNRKLFFLNFAQTFCASATADDALGRSHVNHALAQFTEFSKIFECSPDSYMNPHEKCYLWD